MKVVHGWVTDISEDEIVTMIFEDDCEECVAFPRERFEARVIPPGSIITVNTCFDLRAEDGKDPEVVILPPPPNPSKEELARAWKEACEKYPDTIF